MTDDAQRARRRAHNTRALEHCNAMGRTAGSILWQPLQTRDGKWFMPDGSELAEAPMEWRSERLNTILDEMDAKDALAPLAPAVPQPVEEWKAQVDAALATRLDRVETHQPGPDGSPYGWTEIALVKTTMPLTGTPSPVITSVRIAGEEFKEGDPIFAGSDGKVYRTRVRPATPPSTISLEDLEKAISEHGLAPVKDVTDEFTFQTGGPVKLRPTQGAAMSEKTDARMDVRNALNPSPGFQSDLSWDAMFYEVPEPFRKYRRTNVAEMRPYVLGERFLQNVSISAEDSNAGSPKPGDMIARNPKNHADQWLVAEQYFKDNFEPIE